MCASNRRGWLKVQPGQTNNTFPYTYETKIFVCIFHVFVFANQPTLVYSKIRKKIIIMIFIIIIIIPFVYYTLLFKKPKMAILFRGCSHSTIKSFFPTCDVVSRIGVKHKVTNEGLISRKLPSVCLIVN